MSETCFEVQAEARTPADGGWYPVSGKIYDIRSAQTLLKEWMRDVPNRKFRVVLIEIKRVETVIG